MVAEILEIEVKEVVRNIMHDFSNITELACIYVDFTGQSQSEKFHFSNFCQYIRRIPIFKMQCKYCDMCGGMEALKQQKCCPYVCHAGLVDFAVPIVQGKHLHGFIVSGQINYTDTGIPTLQVKSNLSEDINAQKLLLQVPRYSYSDIISATRILNAVTSAYFPFAGQITGAENLLHLEKAVSKERFCGQNNRLEIKKTIEYITTHLNCDLSLRKLAQEVFLSEAYLSRIFKQEMNINLITYINQCRISEAEKLLLETKETVENISRKLGYKRPSYFCKVFRNEIGETPNMYRQKQKIEK